MALSSVPAARPGSAVPAIETVHLKKYYGRSRGIEDISLRVEEGEIFGFIGPNGAGKSTTIRTLLNFIFPTAGSARVLGHDIVTESLQIREKVGYLPGETGYYDELTVDGLLDYTARFYSTDCRRRGAELVDILEIDRKKPIHSLSLGNKRKVGLVLALMHRPRLLILDEPTAGLDPLMQTRLFELLREENERGTTIFFSSHVLSEVQRLCHRVAIIKEGLIVKVEEVERLRESRLRKVRITFRDERQAAVGLPGAAEEERVGRSVRLLYGGDINELVRHLAGRELESLWVEEPTLEEVFLHYYETDGGTGQDTASGRAGENSASGRVAAVSRTRSGKEER